MNSFGLLPALKPTCSKRPEHLENYLGKIAHHVGLAADGVRALAAADLTAAHAIGQPAIVTDIEGLDFLEMKLERLEKGLRLPDRCALSQLLSRRS